MGNGERFVDRHGDDAKYTDGRGWLGWDGRRYQADEAAVRRKAMETARAIQEEGDHLAPSELGKRLKKHGRNSESRRRLDDQLGVARDSEIVRRMDDEFDQDPMVLNLQKGTPDLRSGELREHRREDLLAKLAPVSWDPEAQTPSEVTTAAVEDAIRVGYRLIDTAASYGNEREVGEGIRRSGVAQDEVFIETKVWINDYGYDATLHAFEKSAPSRTRHCWRLGVSTESPLPTFWALLRDARGRAARRAAVAQTLLEWRRQQAKKAHGFRNLRSANRSEWSMRPSIRDAHLWHRLPIRRLRLNLHLADEVIWAYRSG